jgi:hypothetical protein
MRRIGLAVVLVLSLLPPPTTRRQSHQDVIERNANAPAGVCDAPIYLGKITRVPCMLGTCLVQMMG